MSILKMVYQGQTPNVFSITIPASSAVIPTYSGNPYVGVAYMIPVSGVSLSAITPSATYNIGAGGLVFLDGQNYVVNNSNTSSVTVPFIVI